MTSILAALIEAVRLPRSAANAAEARAPWRAQAAALAAAVTLTAAAVGAAVWLTAPEAAADAVSVTPLRVAALVLDCVLVAVVEEGLFRGIIFGGAVNALAAQGGRTPGRALLTAALAQAVFFGLLHVAGAWPDQVTGVVVVQAVCKVVAATAFGFLMAVLYVRTRTLWAPIALHAAYDLLSLVPQELLAGPEGITTYLTGVAADAWIMAATAAVLVIIAGCSVAVLKTFSQGKR